jgi:hypothetical protein
MRRGGAGRDHDRRRFDEARLVVVIGAGILPREQGIDAGIRLGQHGGRPVLVREAEPAGGVIQAKLLVVLQVAILLRDHVVGAQHAVRALMLDEEVGDLGRAVARHAGIGE